jgi:diguanylate cyclase (GGDEF)-like protein
MVSPDLRNLCELFITLGPRLKSEECELLATYFESPVDALLNEALSDGHLRRCETGELALVDSDTVDKVRNELADHRRQTWQRRLLDQLRNPETAGDDLAEATVPTENAFAGTDGVDSFLSEVSRHLRDPLNIILGYSDAVRTEIAPEENDDLNHYLEAIHEASQRLLETVDEVEHRVVVERKRRKLSDTVRTLSTIIGSTLDFEELLHRVLECIDDIVTFDRAVIRVPRDEGLAVASVDGGQSAHDQNSGLEQISRVDAQIHRQLLDSETPVHRAGKSVGTSVLGVPLIVDDRSVGTLVLESDQPEAFDDYDVELMVTLGQHVGMALLNAKRHSEVRRRAEFDPLTETYSKNHFFEVAERRLRELRGDTAGASVMMLDLDRFKRINDIHGHAVGDAVLAKTAGRLRSHLRDDDLIGRYGGEEFSILAPALDLEGARQVADRLRKQVGESPVQVDDLELQVTVSVGVTETTAEDDLESALKRADEALLEAKRRGRNCLIVHPPPR